MAYRVKEVAENGALVPRPKNTSPVRMVPHSLRIATVVAAVVLLVAGILALLVVLTGPGGRYERGAQSEQIDLSRTEGSFL